MHAPYGARILPVSAAAANANTSLLGGPLMLAGWSLNDGTAAQGLTVDQSAAAPGAGATIASISLPNGTYVVSWTLEITGTPAAGDADNVQALIAATVVATSVNTGTVGNSQQEEFTVTVTGGPLTLAWKAIGAATAGTTYKVEANITPTGKPAATIFDGGMAIAYASMGQGDTQTEWFGDYGPRVRNSISVQTTQGTIAGVLYYSLIYPWDDSADSKQHRE